MNLCYWIADAIHRLRRRRADSSAAVRKHSESDYWRWQQRSSASYFAKFFDLESRLQGADVIDIGCGLGGRTCYLASRGVKRIAGVDINHDEIDRARQLARRLGGAGIEQKVSFEKVAENDPGRGERDFDIALLVDSLEHVRSPQAMLNLAHSLLKPGGVCYFSTWGWYHHQASHVGSIVPIPFATLWFSDRQILDAVRRIVDQPYYQPSIWDSDPPSRRWQGIESLHDRPGEYLNKYTIARFRQAMGRSKFQASELKVQGFSAQRFPLLAPFNFLTQIPMVQELYHSAIFGRLKKAAAQQTPASVGAKRQPSVRAAA